MFRKQQFIPIESSVFEIFGVALPVTLALIAYIGFWLKNVALTPPAAVR